MFLKSPVWNATTEQLDNQFQINDTTDHLLHPESIKTQNQKGGFCHGTIIRTGVTCNKIPCYMRDSACRWFIVKKAKIF